MPREPKKPRPLDANGDPVFTKEELAKIYKAELDDVLPDWPFSKKDLAEIDADMGGGCLHMIGELLGTMECKHGLGAHKDSTPAMMYPEWIVCCVRKALEKQRERDADAAKFYALGVSIACKDEALKSKFEIMALALKAHITGQSLHPDYIPKPKVKNNEQAPAIGG